MWKRLSAEEAEPLWQAGVVLRFDAIGRTGSGDPLAYYVMVDYNNKKNSASPLAIDPTSKADHLRWWVEVE